MLYERITREAIRLQQQMDSIKQMVSSLPPGKLVCCHHGKYQKWYQSDGHTKTYIPKSNRNFAEQLAAQTYLSTLLTDLSQEKTALDFYLRHHNIHSEKASKLLETPSFCDLLSSHFKPISQELTDWMNAPYEQNQHHPEHLIHKTTSGHLVRSKSESMIASCLYTNHIPFRYECALPLDNVFIYPDFTIRHPVTGEIYYWEHFGLMDDPSYSKKTASKLQLYISHEIIPSIQLITTYETMEHPLSTEVIYKIVEHYFL